MVYGGYNGFLDIWRGKENHEGQMPSSEQPRLKSPPLLVVKCWKNDLTSPSYIFWIQNHCGELFPMIGLDRLHMQRAIANT